MFNADRPITNSKQDRLNRAVFAKYLARCILDHKDINSLVVGLYGGWGSGKTSIINLVIEELNFAGTNLLDDEKPIILNFNPWSYSGQNQLIYNFFKRLSASLNVEYLENSSEIIRMLTLYAALIMRQPLPQKKRTWWETITLQNKNKNTWDMYDVTVVKAQLNELLSKQKHKIIIIIDNISRLYDHEIKLIFQIVKSLADYANTTYLLAVDKKHVVRAINHIDGFGGNKYLEKIVQLPFDVPPILYQDLEKIFADHIIEIVQTTPEDAWSIEYWADIYYSSLKYFFENCRDITRYINTLSFSYSRLRDVVNPVDFFALTALEVFTPEIYFGIRENKDLFTDLLDHVYFLDDERIKKDRLRCDEIIDRDQRISRDVILQLFIRLFPRIRKIYFSNERFYYSDATAQKLKRICSPDMFEIYFRLSMKTGQILNSEFETILSLASDETDFDQALTRLNQDDRITKFLDLLDSNFVLDAIPEQYTQTIISALLNNGDLFPQGLSDNILSLDTPMRIHRITHHLLHRIPSNSQRFIILQNAIANASKSIHISIHELQEQTREHYTDTDTFQPIEYRDLTPEQLDSLTKLTVNRIKSWASNGSLENHPQLLSILYAWRDWDENDYCRLYVAEMTKTDRGLIAFLSAALSYPISQAVDNTYYQNPDLEKYLKNINDFIPVNLLEAHAKLLFEDEYFEKLREHEQLALIIFLDLVKTPTKKIIRKTSV